MGEEEGPFLWKSNVASACEAAPMAALLSLTSSILRCSGALLPLLAEIEEAVRERKYLKRREQSCVGTLCSPPAYSVLCASVV